MFICHLNFISTPFLTSCGNGGGSGGGDSDNDSIQQDIANSLTLQNENAEEAFKLLHELNDYDQNIYDLVKSENYEEVARQYTEVYPAMLDEIKCYLGELEENQ